MASEQRPDRNDPGAEAAQGALRNIALALVLAAFVVIVYVGTWAKLGANILNRPL